jgi:DNA-directed RNA polymerase II subunit RPB1
MGEALLGLWPRSDVPHLRFFYDKFDLLSPFEKGFRDLILLTDQMSKGFHRDRQEDIESVIAVQFSIFSDREIEERSVVEVTSQATYEGSEPKTGGLFDARMGVLDNGKKCLSCGQTNHGCPGHFGHFRLTRPVYYIQFFEEVQKILRCVCIRCSKLLIDKNLNKDNNN